MRGVAMIQRRGRARDPGARRGDSGTPGLAFRARGVARPRRIVLALALALAVLPPGLAAEPIPMPPLAVREQGEYRARDLKSGQELWRTHWLLTQDLEQGRPVLRLREDGKRLGESVVPPTWTVRMTIDLWGTAPRLSSVREAQDASGRPAHVEHRELDYAAGSGRIVTTDVATGKAETQTVRVTRQSITPELLAAALRLLPGAPDRQMRFDLITRGGTTIGMRAKVLGREHVEVPAGGFDCLKVELDPTGFYGVLADIMLPRLFMWHTASSPHYWVKYQGPEGGLGSRQIVRELVSFKAGE